MFNRQEILRLSARNHELENNVSALNEEVANLKNEIKGLRECFDIRNVPYSFTPVYRSKKLDLLYNYLGLKYITTPTEKLPRIEKIQKGKN